MSGISLIDYLAARLDILRMELRNPANRQRVMTELLNTPDQRFNIMEWSVTITYLLRDNYYFSSVEKAKSFIQTKYNIETGMGKQQRGQKNIIKKWGIPIICGLTVVLLMRNIFMFGFVSSSSMEPTLPEGSFFIGLRICSDYEAGDVIVFSHDGGVLVKRIVAGPYDTVYINERTRFYSLTSFPEATRSLIVPLDSYYVVGDNINNSLDSRFWDNCFIQSKDVLARVLLLG